MTEEMSLIPVEKEELTELEKIKKEEMEKSSEGIVPVIPKLKILRENQMFADVDGQSFREFEGVILFSQIIRGCWLAETGKVPLCSSKTGIRGGMSQNIEQINPAVTTILENAQNADFICSKCANNKWGTSEGVSKPCTEKRRTLVLTTRGVFPYILEMPTTSMKNWDTYISALIQKGTPAILVLTKFTLEKQEDSQRGYVWSRIICNKDRDLSKEEIFYALKLRKKFSEAAKGIDVESEEHYNKEREENDTSSDAKESEEPIEKEPIPEEKAPKKESGEGFIEQLEREKQEKIMAETKKKANAETKKENRKNE